MEVVSNFLHKFNDIMMEMTNMVMMAAPIGVYCLIARTFSNIGFRDLFRWQIYALCTWSTGDSLPWQLFCIDGNLYKTESVQIYP